jgi:hypothetical protein
VDLKRFAIRMKKLGGNVGQNGPKLLRKVALSVDATVVSATPVDTGRARSNWVAEINSPATGTREPYSPGKEGSTGGPNAQAAIEQARAVISTYKSGQAVHLTNNLPYIGALNDGHSAQAPAGFVQTAVLNGIAQVRGVKLLDDNGVK